MVKINKSIGSMENYGAFAARNSTGKVITWGDVDNGGDSSEVSSSLSSGVTKLFSNKYSFSALKGNSVITWGHKYYKENKVLYYTGSSDLTEIKGIYTTDDSSFFVCLREDGTYISWGAFEN